MLTIRQRGAFKPWGGRRQRIEIALWDIAGKARRRADLQAARRQRCATACASINGAIREPMTSFGGRLRRVGSQDEAARRASPSSSRASASTAA